MSPSELVEFMFSCKNGFNDLQKKPGSIWKCLIKIVDENFP